MQTQFCNKFRYKNLSTALLFLLSFISYNSNHIVVYETIDFFVFWWLIIRRMLLVDILTISGRYHLNIYVLFYLIYLQLTLAKFLSLVEDQCELANVLCKHSKFSLRVMFSMFVVLTIYNNTNFVVKLEQPGNLETSATTRFLNITVLETTREQPKLLQTFIVLCLKILLWRNVVCELNLCMHLASTYVSKLTTTKEV